MIATPSRYWLLGIVLAAAAGLSAGAQSGAGTAAPAGQQQVVHVFNNAVDPGVENGSGYFGVRNYCVWAELRGDPGGPVPAETHCHEINSRVTTPGFSYGNPDPKLYLGSHGWQHNVGAGIRLECLTTGICSGLAVDLAHFGQGDANAVDVLATTQWGHTAPSDEGVTALRAQIQEVITPFSAKLAAIEAAGTQTSLTVTAVRNPAYLAPAQALVDTSKMLLAKQAYRSGGNGAFATMEITAPDGSPLKEPLPVSTCATILHPVATGGPARDGLTARVASWQAAPPREGVAVFTFQYTAARALRPGEMVYLDGFRGAGVPAGMNGSVVQVIAATAGSFTANVFSAGRATGPVPEAGAEARLWWPGRIASGGTSTMTVTVSKPVSGSGFDATGVVFLEDVFPEQTVPAGAPVVQADGSVVLRLPLRFEHAVGRMVCQGGLAGYRVNMPGYSGRWATYVQYISGSVSPHAIREGFVQQGSITAFGYGGQVQIMPGTDVVSVLNPKSGKEDFSTFVTEPVAGFAPGDALLEPPNISASAVGENLVLAAFSPYASYKALGMQWPGAAVGESYGILMNFHGNQTADVKDGYPGILSEGGVLQPPTVLRAYGIARDVVDVNVPPDSALLDVRDCRDAAFSGGSRMYSLWQQGGPGERAALTYAPCSHAPGEEKTLFLRGAGLAVEGPVRAAAVSVTGLAASSAVCTDAARGLTTNCPGGTGKAAAAAGENVLPYTAAPVFDVRFASNVITLRGPVSGFTLAAGQPGERETLVFCQDAVGGRTVAAPGNVRGFFRVGPQPNTCSTQSFVWSAALGGWMADSPGVVNE